MIIDKITNLSKYRFLVPQISSIVEYLSCIDIELMAVGKYELLGTDIFHFCFIYKTLPFEQCSGEVHVRYVDIHIIVKGRETVGVLDGTTDKFGQYDAKTDHASVSGSFRKFTLAEGDFVIFFQHEGHITSVHAEASVSEEVKRLVFKIPLTLV